jgi:DNA-binding transcriptional MerR regulator
MVATRCEGLTEYRLEELAQVSGVSARNIRAYRERGLLDPPRRAGRSAIYDDSHLAQLQTINQLLRRGFNSVHIAEFFASMRAGADLADILGLQRAVLSPQREATASAPADDRAVPVLDVDAESDEARRLVEVGLADSMGKEVRLKDPALAEIVGRARDQVLYVRALLRIFESTRGDIDTLAGAVVAALEECLAARFGPDFVPEPHQMPELSRIVQDYRELANKVVVDHLDAALQQQMVSAVSGYTAGILLSDRREHRAI